MKQSSGQAGIREIADALGISIGTVDRALHHRSGVSERTKALVLGTAARLGYRPNLAARALKLNRHIMIAAVLPVDIRHFFDPLRSGIRAGAAALPNVHVTVQFYDYPRIGEGENLAFRRALRAKPDGVVFVPGDRRASERAMRSIARAGYAMMCVGSDATDMHDTSFVAAHSRVSGAIAAELLAWHLPPDGRVAVFSGQLDTADHAEKHNAFAATIRERCHGASVLPALESHEQPREAYAQAKKMMRGKFRPHAVYLSTANGSPVLEALRQLGLLGLVRIVATDLYPEVIAGIEAGDVLCTLHQRPFTQGRLALEHLVASIMTPGSPLTGVRLAPQVVLRSNLSLFGSTSLEESPELLHPLLPGASDVLPFS